MEETDSFPPYNGLRECQIIQDYYITISPDAEVTVNTQGAAALAEDLERLREELKAIPRVLVGPKNTELRQGDVLLIMDDEELPDLSWDFVVAAPTNLVISDQSPAEGDNWGIVEGKMIVGSTPEEDTTFFGQI